MEDLWLQSKREYLVRCWRLFWFYGQAFQESGLEDELLVYFMSEISKGKKTPEQIKALIAQGDQAKFEMQRTDKGDLTQKHVNFKKYQLIF